MSRAPKPVDPIDREVTAVLKDRYENCGLSLRVLTARCGVGNSRLNSIFRGLGAPPTFGEVSRVASALGMSLEDVVAQVAGAPAPDLPEPPPAEMPVVVRSRLVSLIKDATTHSVRLLPAERDALIRWALTSQGTEDIRVL